MDILSSEGVFMSIKITNGVFLIYAVLISFFITLLAGAAVRARENALSPFDYLSMKSISEVINENVSAPEGV